MFLDILNENGLDEKKVAKLDSVYHFRYVFAVTELVTMLYSQSTNMELKFRFFLLAIKAGHDESLPGALAFVSSIGTLLLRL